MPSGFLASLFGRASNKPSTARTQAEAGPHEKQKQQHGLSTSSVPPSHSQNAPRTLSTPSNTSQRLSEAPLSERRQGLLSRRTRFGLSREEPAKLERSASSGSSANRLLSADRPPAKKSCQKKAAVDGGSPPTQHRRQVSFSVPSEMGRSEYRHRRTKSGPNTSPPKYDDEASRPWLGTRDWSALRQNPSHRQDKFASANNLENKERDRAVGALRPENVPDKSLRRQRDDDVLATSLKQGGFSTRQALGPTRMVVLSPEAGSTAKQESPLAQRTLEESAHAQGLRSRDRPDVVRSDDRRQSDKKESTGLVGPSDDERWQHSSNRHPIVRDRARRESDGLLRQEAGQASPRPSQSTPRRRRPDLHQAERPLVGGARVESGLGRRQPGLRSSRPAPAVFEMVGAR